MGERKMKNKIPIIAFDEAGNTGQNLLDKDQPIFTLASVNFNEKELDEIFNIFKTNSQELHFKNLRKYSKTKKQLIEFFNHQLIDKSKIKYFYWNKKFATIVNMVDMLVEPVFKNEGIDFYNGYHMALPNVLFMYSENIWNSDIVDKLLNNFIKMIRDKSNISINGFYSSLNELYNIINKEDRPLLSAIVESEYIIKDIIANIYKYSIDLTLPSFITLCNSWYNELNKNFDIYHDQSKQINYWKELIEFTSSPEFMNDRNFNFRKQEITFPLKINELKLVNSLNYKQVQIADLVASSVSYLYTAMINKNDNTFARQLSNSKLLKINHNAVIPSNDITKNELDITDNVVAENILNYHVEMASKSENEYIQIIKKM